MLRGLEGRRIALSVVHEDDSVERHAGIVSRALEQSGARMHLLQAGEGTEEDWHGARYVALVIVGDGAPGHVADARLVQLAREFLASEKPVAVFGGGVSVVLEAGGAAGRKVAAQGPLKSAVERAGGTVVDSAMTADGSLITALGSTAVEEFATRVVREFSNQLEEREVDEMSEASFPASDPPATTPSSLGPVSTDPDSGARP
ncbi:MAG: DJ-1/PfpI family protein [Gemmatimonadaceae bacterium]